MRVEEGVFGVYQHHTSGTAANIGSPGRNQKTNRRTDRLRKAQVERARYEASLAQRRYMKVDPANRLVADTLETKWNSRLRLLAEAEQNYQRQRQSDQLVLNDTQSAQILALATNFRQVWHNPALPHRERKRMVRLLIEDVTVVKRDSIMLHVRFRGGATQSLAIPAPPDAWHRRRTSDSTVDEINKLLDNHTCAEIAGILNSKGLQTGTGMPFSADIVDRLIHGRKLRSRQTRLREQGISHSARSCGWIGHQHQ